MYIEPNLLILQENDLETKNKAYWKCNICHQEDDYFFYYFIILKYFNITIHSKNVPKVLIGQRNPPGISNFRCNIDGATHDNPSVVPC